MAAIVVSSLPVPAAYANLNVTIPGKYFNPEWLPERNVHSENARVTLSGVPDDMIPNNSNKWNCDCSSSGCWPGCFTLASASIMKYWSQKGYPTLYNGDENAVLVRLRQLFPNMLCYGNGDTSGKPSDVGYDAFDVATGLMQYTRANGYVFSARAVPEPTFAQIMDEIDAGRPVIGAFAESPWGSHAGTIVGYDTTNGRKIMIVRPNLWKKLDMDIEWGVGYKGFGIVTVLPPYPTTAPRNAAKTEASVRPQVSIERVVGAKDAGFAAQGNWQLNSSVGLSGDARSHVTTDPSNLGPTDDTGWARWTPDLPYDGVWEAMAWIPMRDGDDSDTHSATYRVTHAEGMSLVRRSQHDATQGWMSLGNFPFVKGNKGSVYAGNLTGDYPLRKVWADAVKFVWRAPLLVRDEPDDAPIYLIQQGKRLRIPDQETFDALRLNRSNIRVLTTFALAQYPDGGMLPSVFTGWVGQYYDNTQLDSASALIRADAHVSFDWNTALAPVMNASNFSARWSRRMAFTDGHYPFVLNASGNARLFVDGEQVISNWDADNHGIYLQQSGLVTLTSGLHLVEIEYFNRAGSGRIALAQLPPNAPVIASAPVVTWTSIPTITLNWLDTGAPEGASQAHKFYVTAWRAGDNWSLSSEWITRTSWTLPLDADGHYYWRVSAGNETALSDWSPAQEIFVDRTAPWAQMVAASNKPEDAPHISSAVEGQPVPADLVVDASRSAPAVNPTVDMPTATLRLPGIRLTWWATDTQSGVASVDIQAREQIHAATIYTPAVQMVEVTKIAYELTLSGSQQITNALVITAQIPYTTVVPLMVYKTLTSSDWLTVATGLSSSNWVFSGNPGSTYEFRVRAHDHAGNAQPWYDGYSVQAQMSPDQRITRMYIPLLLR